MYVQNLGDSSGWIEVYVEVQGNLEGHHIAWSVDSKKFSAEK